MQRQKITFIVMPVMICVTLEVFEPQLLSKHKHFQLLFDPLPISKEHYTGFLYESSNHTLWNQFFLLLGVQGCGWAKRARGENDQNSLPLHRHQLQTLVPTLAPCPMERKVRRRGRDRAAVCNRDEPQSRADDGAAGQTSDRGGSSAPLLLLQGPPCCCCRVQPPPLQHREYKLQAEGG